LPSGGAATLGILKAVATLLMPASTVKAMGNMWGALTDTCIIKKSKNIPVISFHGDKDDIVPIDFDFPFKNTFMVNRLVMNKVYGSRPIHEQLNRLGIDNKLIVFENKGHEPQLNNFKTINETLGLISNELVQFFFKYTAPQISMGKTTVAQGEKIKPLDIKVSNGSIEIILVSGGLQVSPDPAEKSIIWFTDANQPSLTVYAKNKHEAVNSVSQKVVLTME
jgi:hypothetical protein